MDTNEKLKAIEKDDNTPFYKSITKGDIVNFITSCYIFIVSYPIIKQELDAPHGYSDVVVFGVQMPKAQWVVFLAVLLTMIVNNSRTLLTLGVIYLKNKIGR